MTDDPRVYTPTLPQASWKDREVVIQTRNLTKQFGSETAVENVTLYVPKGSLFGFIGPSGSGKTTTIRMLTGYYAPSSGEIEVFGKPPTRFSQSMRARIGYMPQLFVLYPELSVWENLNFAASIYGERLIGRRKKLDQILDFVELTGHTHKLAREISGGMQRRLSLAATLVHDPDLIFLDEPTAGIDPVLREKFWQRFRDLRDSGRTLFVTTQYVGESAYCDLVGVMGEGRLLTVDTPDMLRHKAFGGEIVDMVFENRADYQMVRRLSEMPFVQGSVIRTSDNAVRLTVDEASTAMPALLDWAREADIPIRSIEEYQPPFDEVFVQIVRKNQTRPAESGEG